MKTVRRIVEALLSEYTMPNGRQASDKYAKARQKLLADRQNCPDCKAAQKEALQYGELKKGYSTYDLYCNRHKS